MELAVTRSYKPVIIWLATGALLVSAMVVIGGITRLTQSGLSIVEWNLIMGAIPPTSKAEWENAFELYKQSPEFNLVNYDFTMADFKSIFWWEYIHRLVGRIIGIIFIVPFLIFFFQKRIDSKLMKKLLFIFALGAFQGFLGWFMVKSGLVNQPHVSHLRLTAHLITAFATFVLILWTILGVSNPQLTPGVIKKAAVRTTTILVGILLVVQIVYGAFVAGLKAGLYYNTWPFMGSSIIPAEVGASVGRDGVMALVNNVTAVQFAHRWLAFAVAAAILVLWNQSRNSNLSAQAKTSIGYLLVAVVLQIIIGIGTLVMKVPVFMGVLHQFLALALLALFTFFVFHIRHIPQLTASERR